VCPPPPPHSTAGNYPSAVFTGEGRNVQTKGAEIYPLERSMTKKTYTVSGLLLIYIFFAVHPSHERQNGIYTKDGKFGFILYSS
jgi:hypothetical protein